jgi:hypothetical protein
MNYKKSKVLFCLILIFLSSLQNYYAVRTHLQHSNITNKTNAEVATSLDPRDRVTIEPDDTNFASLYYKPQITVPLKKSLLGITEFVARNVSYSQEDSVALNLTQLANTTFTNMFMQFNSVLNQIITNPTPSSSSEDQATKFYEPMHFVDLETPIKLYKSIRTGYVSLNDLVNEIFDTIMIQPVLAQTFLVKLKKIGFTYIYDYIEIALAKSTKEEDNKVYFILRCTDESATADSVVLGFMYFNQVEPNKQALTFSNNLDGTDISNLQVITHNPVYFKEHKSLALINVFKTLAKHLRPLDSVDLARYILKKIEDQIDKFSFNILTQVHNAHRADLCKSLPVLPALPANLFPNQAMEAITKELLSQPYLYARSKKNDTPQYPFPIHMSYMLIKIFDLEEWKEFAHCIHKILITVNHADFVDKLTKYFKRIIEDLHFSGGRNLDADINNNLDLEIENFKKGLVPPLVSDELIEDYKDFLNSVIIKLLSERVEGTSRFEQNFKKLSINYYGKSMPQLELYIIAKVGEYIVRLANNSNITRQQLWLDIDNIGADANKFIIHYLYCVYEPLLHKVIHTIPSIIPQYLFGVKVPGFNLLNVHEYSLEKHGITVKPVFEPAIFKLYRVTNSTVLSKIVGQLSLYDAVSVCLRGTLLVSTTVKSNSPIITVKSNLDEFSALNPLVIHSTGFFNTGRQEEVDNLLGAIFSQLTKEDDATPLDVDHFTGLTTAYNKVLTVLTANNETLLEVASLKAPMILSNLKMEDTAYSLFVPVEDPTIKEPFLAYFYNLNKNNLQLVEGMMELRRMISYWTRKNMSTEKFRHFFNSVANIDGRYEQVAPHLFGKEIEPTRTGFITYSTEQFYNLLKSKKPAKIESKFAMSLCHEDHIGYHEALEHYLLNCNWPIVKATPHTTLETLLHLQFANSNSMSTNDDFTIGFYNIYPNSNLSAFLFDELYHLVYLIKRNDQFTDIHKAELIELINNLESQSNTSDSSNTSMLAYINNVRVVLEQHIQILSSKLKAKEIYPVSSTCKIVETESTIIKNSPQLETANPKNLQIQKPPKRTISVNAIKTVMDAYIDCASKLAIWPDANTITGNIKALNLEPLLESSLLDHLKQIEGIGKKWDNFNAYQSMPVQDPLIDLMNTVHTALVHIKLNGFKNPNLETLIVSLFVSELSKANAREVVTTCVSNNALLITGLTDFQKEHALHFKLDQLELFKNYEDMISGLSLLASVEPTAVRMIKDFRKFSIQLRQLKTESEKILNKLKLAKEEMDKNSFDVIDEYTMTNKTEIYLSNLKIELEQLEAIGLKYQKIEQASESIKGIKQLVHVYDKEAISELTKDLKKRIITVFESYAKSLLDDAKWNQRVEAAMKQEINNLKASIVSNYLSGFAETKAGIVEDVFTENLGVALVDEYKELYEKAVAAPVHILGKIYDVLGLCNKPTLDYCNRIEFIGYEDTCTSTEYIRNLGLFLSQKVPLEILSDWFIHAKLLLDDSKVADLTIIDALNELKIRLNDYKTKGHSYSSINIQHSLSEYLVEFYQYLKGSDFTADKLNEATKNLDSKYVKYRNNELGTTDTTDTTAPKKNTFSVIISSSELFKTYSRELKESIAEVAKVKTYGEIVKPIYMDIGKLDRLKQLLMDIDITVLNDLITPVVRLLDLAEMHKPIKERNQLNVFGRAVYQQFSKVAKMISYINYMNSLDIATEMTKSDSDLRKLFILFFNNIAKPEFEGVVLNDFVDNVGLQIKVALLSETVTSQKPTTQADILRLMAVNNANEKLNELAIQAPMVTKNTIEEFKKADTKEEVGAYINNQILVFLNQLTKDPRIIELLNSYKM